MSKEKVLTKGIAEQFLAFRPVDLIEFTEIKDAAAESLSKSKSSLRLNGLTQLSDAVAESLSKHQGFLELTGLTELSEAAAESLSKIHELVVVDTDILPASAVRILRDAGYE